MTEPLTTGPPTRTFTSQLHRIRETLNPSDPSYCAELLDIEDARYLLAWNLELVQALNHAHAILGDKATSFRPNDCGICALISRLTHTSV